MAGTACSSKITERRTSPYTRRGWGGGLFAVQLAKSRGAYVIATSSKANIDFVKQLGANEVIDYRERRFEEAGIVDVIFDTVGGETLDRSWDLLKPSGRVVTLASEVETRTASREKR